MSFTYTFADCGTLAKEFAHGIPITAFQPQVLDMASARMWQFRMWRWTIQNISPDITLVDGTQDYSVPASIYRLRRARIYRTDVTPNEYLDPLDVVEELEPNLTKLSIYEISAIALDYPTGLFRLNAPPQVSTAGTMKLAGDFQQDHTKITSSNMSSLTIWFPDVYLQTFFEGVKYFFYMITDDPRAGGVVTDATSGRKTFSGQYGTFMDALWAMAEAEDLANAAPLIYPSEALGASRQAIAPWRI